MTDVLAGKSQKKLPGSSFSVILSVLWGFLETLALYDKQSNYYYKDKICLQYDVENSCFLEQVQWKTDWSWMLLSPWRRGDINFFKW